MGNWIYSVETRAGGKVDMGIMIDKMYGLQALLHIDQSTNIKNGEDEASIVLNIEELKSLQKGLSDFIEFLEKTYNV